MTPNCDIIIEADWVITQNGQRDILRNAAVAVANGRIIDIGARERVTSAWQPGTQISLGNNLLMPALINGHTHTAMTFLRGLADDLPLMEWLTKTVFPVEAGLKPEIVYLGSLLGQAEMVATGCGSCIDMYIFEEEVLKAAETTGMRCMGGEAIFNFPSAACATPEAALEVTEELAGKYAGHERIKLAINPHAVYTTTDELLLKCRAYADRLKLPVHIHLAETPSETARCLDEFGQRPVERVVSLGLFDGQGIAAHLVDITCEEAQELAKLGAIGIHNPASNMKLASGAAPIAMSDKNGLYLGLGTDGPASNNQLNMFQEMRQAALLGKLASLDPALVPAQMALDMATLGGGKAFGLPGLGTLEVGAPADMIALDINRPNMLPMFNPVSQAVYAANGSECKLTMVNGEILYRDGAYTRFDYKDVLKAAQELVNFVRKKV